MIAPYRRYDQPLGDLLVREPGANKHRTSGSRPVSGSGSASTQMCVCCSESAGKVLSKVRTRSAYSGCFLRATCLPFHSLARKAPASPLGTAFYCPPRPLAKRRLAHSMPDHGLRTLASIKGQRCSFPQTRYFCQTITRPEVNFRSSAIRIARTMGMNLTSYKGRRVVRSQRKAMLSPQMGARYA